MSTFNVYTYELTDKVHDTGALVQEIYECICCRMKIMNERFLICATWATYNCTCWSCDANILRSLQFSLFLTFFPFILHIRSECIGCKKKWCINWNFLVVKMIRNNDRILWKLKVNWSWYFLKVIRSLLINKEKI